MMGDPADGLWLLLYLAMCVGGGWLLVRSGFRLGAGDGAVVGAALGISLSTWLANLIGHWIDPPGAFWAAAGLLLAAGLVSWRGRAKRQGGRIDARSWALLLAVVGLSYLFFQIGRGLAVFDDRKNLSLISLMAAGEIPPRFYMNPDSLFAYHYGFQLFGSALMRLGGLLPWTAFDLAKGIVGGLMMGMAIVWGRRATGKWAGGVCFGAMLLLASGTRWLLLFLPARWVAAASAGIGMWGSGAATSVALPEALRSAWVIEGGPPFPLPFAYVNGILQPLILQLQAGPVSMGLIALFLLLVLYPARRTRWSSAVLVAVGAFWALAAEAGFVLGALGMSAACVVVLALRRTPEDRRRMVGVLAGVALAIALATLQGGTLTEAARQLAAGSVGLTSHGDAGLAGFTLRQVPAIVSSHLGELRLTRSGELLVGLLELGPALLLAPLAFWVMLRAARRGRELPLAVGASAVLGFLLPFVVRYQVDRDITRLTVHALIAWLLLAAAPLALTWAKGGIARRGAIALGVAVLTFGGLTVAGPLLTALSRPVISDGFLPADVAMTRLTWNRLAPGSLIIDSSAWRAVAVTGRLTRSAKDSQTSLPSWRQMVAKPTVDRLVVAGFDYAYVDTWWWKGLSDSARQSFLALCVVVAAEVHDDGDNGDRWLFDLRACR